MISMTEYLKNFKAHILTHIDKPVFRLLSTDKMKLLDLPKNTFTFCGYVTTYAYSPLNRHLYFCTEVEKEDFDIVCDINGFTIWRESDWLKIDRKIQNLVIIGNSVEVGI